MSSEQAGGTPGSGAMSDRMRALLSRAAEEQLLEQRQVSSVLGQLRALVEDVDERQATGEQVERVAAEVRALSARVEVRLDAAEARSAELAERFGEATALVGQAAQDLAGRVEARLREVVADLTASVDTAVQTSERRLTTHVDDAVLALAEVVLRRRSAAAGAAPGRVPGPTDGAEPAGAGEGDPQAATELDDTGAGVPQAPALVDVPPVPPAADVPPRAEPAGDLPPAEALALPVPGEPALIPGRRDAPELCDGFVLVPADVEEPDAGPAPPVLQERRTSERRTAPRSDGSGRRRRPWWRPV